MRFEDSPALHWRDPESYPFANKVPRFIKMLSRVRPDFVYQKRDAVTAESGSTYPAWTNSYGAVSAIINGVSLGLKPGEFEVISWWHGTHIFKCDQVPFRALWQGLKTCEIRDLADRPEVCVGDEIQLFEQNLDGLFTGLSIIATITHMQAGYKLPKTVRVMSFGHGIFRRWTGSNLPPMPKMYIAAGLSVHPWYKGTTLPEGI